MVILCRKLTRAEEYTYLRPLIKEYVRWLGEDICYQGLDKELEELPLMYGQERGGAAFLAENRDRGVLGGGCLRALSSSGEGICEMKRLFVRPEARGLGLGLQLARLLIGEARKLGYDRMRLDTLERLTGARKLYESLGFRQIDAYCENPLKGPLFYELDLTSPTGRDALPSSP